MEQFIIQGRKKLKGEIEVRGSKNAAFPVLAATLLTTEDCLIRNLPLIEDVLLMLELFKSMGAEVSWQGERVVKINTKAVDPNKINKSLISKFRGSVLLYGPLLSRFGKIDIPQPGGCLIGVRPINTHLDAFRQVGVKIEENKGFYSLKLDSKKRINRKVILNEFSVTGTENILLLASLLPGKTILKTADQDYAVQELSKFLRKMGVKITETGAHCITIEGKKKLKGVKHKLIYDPIEAGTFIIIAAITKGDVLVKNVELSFLDFPLKRLKDFGLSYEIKDKNSIIVKEWNSIKIDKIQSLPYPGFPTDLQPVFGILATQAEGTTIIHDPLYEGRLKYLEEINKMGAKIFFVDPHRALVAGPTPLYGTKLRTFDLRGGASFIISGLIAQGETVIDNIYQVDRGYEKIEERLQKIGADIRRVKV